MGNIRQDRAISDSNPPSNTETIMKNRPVNSNNEFDINKFNVWCKIHRLEPTDRKGRQFLIWCYIEKIGLDLDPLRVKTIYIGDAKPGLRGGAPSDINLSRLDGMNNNVNINDIWDNIVKDNLYQLRDLIFKQKQCMGSLIKNDIVENDENMENLNTNIELFSDIINIKQSYLNKFITNNQQLTLGDRRIILKQWLNNQSTKDLDKYMARLDEVISNKFDGVEGGLYPAYIRLFYDEWSKLQVNLDPFKHLVGLVDSPSESSESVSPSPSLAGHQNQQIYEDNQQVGGDDRSIIQGLIAKIIAIINYNKNNNRSLTLCSKRFVGIEGLTPRDKENLIEALTENYSFNYQLYGKRAPGMNLVRYLETLTIDPGIPTPTITGLIEKIIPIIRYNDNNKTGFNLYSGQLDGIERLTHIEKEYLIKVVGDKFERQAKGTLKPSGTLIDHLKTLTENPLYYK